MLQSLNVEQQNINTFVTGYELALSKVPVAARAFTAATLVLGWAVVVDPRITQAARLARVSVPSVDAALAILQSGDRDLEVAARISLFEAAVVAKHPHSLVDQYMASSSADRAVLAKTVGPGMIWDELIVPNI